MKSPIAAVTAKLQAARRVLVVAHVFPDCDAMGSQLALGNILASLGKEVVLFTEEPVSHLLDFLPGCERVVNEIADFTEFDCAVALDCGDGRRLGKFQEQLLAISPFLVIDHHSGHEDFGDLRWVEEGLSSTGEMIYELAVALGVELDLDSAICLYAAMAADTGSFIYSSTAARTLAIAGELVALGVKPAEIAARLFDNFSKNRLQLLQMVLASLELYEDERLAVISVSQEQYRLTGTTPEDTELFINYPRSLQTVVAAAFVKEGPEGFIGVSLRSKGDFDVAVVARRFGGGGHRNAAGFKMPGQTIAGVRKKLLPELRARL